MGVVHMEYIINNENLKIEDVTDFGSKARAILLTNDNQILIANYGGNYLLPGGSVNNNENITDTIKRELSEELGLIYNENELNFIGTIYHFQKNYPKRNGTTANRIIKTSIFIGDLKSTNFENKKLTVKEKNDGFNLVLVTLDALKQMVLNNPSNNPRKIFFQEEMEFIYNNMIQSRLKCKTLQKRSSK